MFPASAPSQGEALPLTSSVLKGAEPKNSLIHYCRKSCLPMPTFQVVNEGPPHAPEFRGTVLVNGESFASPNTFLQRRAAEQDAAKLALAHLLTVNKAAFSVDLRKLVSQDKSLCKMIVYELAVKMNLGRCKYETLEVKEHSTPTFASSLVLNGTRYKGDFGKSKKEAEQLAAHAAILSLLGDPTYAVSLSEVIMPKLKPYAAFLGKGLEINISVIDKAVRTATVDNNILTPLNQQVGAIEQSSSRVMVNNNMPEMANSEAETVEQGGSRVLTNKVDDSGVLCSNKNVPQMVNSQDKIKEQAGHGVIANEQGSSPVVADKQGDSEGLGSKNMPEMVNSQAKMNEQGVLAQEQGDFGGSGNENTPEMMNSSANNTKEQGDSGVIANDNETLFTKASCHGCIEMHPSPHESQLQHPDPSISQPIGFPDESTQSATVPSQDSVSRSTKKRQRRKKNKANKRLQTENNDGTDVAQVPTEAQRGEMEGSE
ncbi:PREDICTED: uncharacterized protein LOC104826735 [Tarenaya hassleriana]|uniref:uncharacterized protein LOC104826735 n=1 Tax=Tarenaya hassleriana TaxID=28532 RepID=UPI00053C5644|nr:PREDICTED: uncharacterized protein LOC104826735 [Tarenaya hassleriana]